MIDYWMYTISLKILLTLILGKKLKITLKIIPGFIWVVPL